MLHSTEANIVRIGSISSSNFIQSPQVRHHPIYRLLHSLVFLNAPSAVIFIDGRMGCDQVVRICMSPSQFIHGYKGSVSLCDASNAYFRGCKSHFQTMSARIYLICSSRADLLDGVGFTLGSRRADRIATLHLVRSNRIDLESVILCI
jgi:hypothetical protein